MISLTVGITSYNQFNFLSKAVKSVINQKLINEKDINLKVIIGHDNPKRKLYFKDLKIKPSKKIKIINHKVNLGEVGNLNYLLSLCTTEWFCWLADDDLWHPYYLSSVLNVAKDADISKVSGIYSDYSFGSSIEKSFKNKKISNLFKHKLYQKEFLNWFVLNPKKLIGCYGIMRTSCLKKVRYPKLGNSFSPYSDDLISILLSKQGKIIWTDEKLLFLRTHNKSKSVSSIEISAYTSAQDDFLDIFFKTYKFTKKEKEFYIIKLLIRFIYDDFNVLFRNKKLTLSQLIFQFLKIQNEKKIKYKIMNRLYFNTYIFLIPIKIIATKLFRKIMPRY